MTVQTTHAPLGVTAHLVLVHDRVLLSAVTLGALARGAHERGARLVGLDARSLTVDEEGPHDQREPDDDGDEHGTERHRPSPARISTEALPRTNFSFIARVFNGSVRSRVRVRASAARRASHRPAGRVAAASARPVFRASVPGPR